VIRNLLYQIDESLVIKSTWGMINHDIDGIVVFIIVGIKIDGFSPEEESFADS